tara:strand:- start:833 stop:1156 length:324 start_codon:yes stop_codon:yes gene_type:complete
MKKFNFFLILNLIFVMLTSCGTIKEGFSMQKKDNSDEFLVEKKSPLLMPPDFDELPVPNSDSSLNNNENNEIKKLITKSEDNISGSDNSENANATVEEFILDKIKNN